MEDQTQKNAVQEEAKESVFQPAGRIDLLWIVKWTLLMTLAIPAALMAMSSLAVAFMWLLNSGARAGLWETPQPALPQSLGVLTALALALASVQWYMLRLFLPKAWLWFLATGAGVLIGGLVSAAVLAGLSVQNWRPVWSMAAGLLPIGLALGVVQWLYLRRYLSGAFWIVLIDLVAAASFLVSGRSFESLAELAVIFSLPGVITGTGLWLLLRCSSLGMLSDLRMETLREKGRQKPLLRRVGFTLAALVPLFFACIWAYTASQLALAKNEGVYSTPEEAIIARCSQGFGGAEVLRIDGVWAEPNNSNAQPHVWFGGATVYMDRAPQGYSWTSYSLGSFYLRVRDGWVHVPEGAFPEFIGWVMTLYNMEGVR